MVIVSPVTGVVPLPNGWTSWFINTGDPNYLPIGMILQVPFPKLTYSPSRKVVGRLGRCLYFLLKWFLFRCYVSFREGNPYLFSFLPSKSRPVLLSHRAAWPSANVEPAGKPIQPWNGGDFTQWKINMEPKKGRFERWFSLNHFGDVRFPCWFSRVYLKISHQTKQGVFLVASVDFSLHVWVERAAKNPQRGSLPTQTWDICTRVDLLKGMVIPPLLGNPFNGYMNPYYWVDELIPCYMEIMGVDRPAHINIDVHGCYFVDVTVDGRNPANHLRLVVYPTVIGFQTSQVVQDFFHQQYYVRISLVGGWTNPIETYVRQIGNHFPNFRVKIQKIFELPPPRSSLYGVPTCAYILQAR